VEVGLSMQQIDGKYPKMCQVLADREFVGSHDFFFLMLKINGLAVLQFQA